MQGFEIARHETAVPPVDIGDCSKTVVLQFENEIGVVEGLMDQTEPHGPDSGEHRASNLRGEATILTSRQGRNVTLSDACAATLPVPIAIVLAKDHSRRRFSAHLTHEPVFQT